MNLIANLLPPSNILLDTQVTSKKRVFEQAGLVAVPHGRIKGLREPVASLVRVQDPIPFDAPDGQPVKLLMFLLVPESANQHHLDILSELAQMLSDKDFREKLMTETDPGATHQLIANWEPYQPAS